MPTSLHPREADTPAGRTPETRAAAGHMTRRGLLAGGIGAAALLGLSACGSSDDSAGSHSPGSGSAPRPSSAATSRRVSTLHGEVTVPAAPKRIVPFDFPEVCALLDLGITPVGRTTYVPDFAAYSTALKGVPAIDEASSGNLAIEKIAALRPDLIIGDDWADPGKQRAPYATLQKIAPTAVFAWEQAAGNWPALAAQTAAAVGRTAELKALQATYADKAATTKSRYAALLAATRWDVIDCGKDSWDLYSANSSHGKVLAGAGLRLGAGASQSDGYQQYSLERLGMLSATGAIITTPASLPFLRGQPLFTALPAVKAGRVYTTSLFFPASYGIATALLDEFATMCGTLQKGA